MRWLLIALTFSMWFCVVLTAAFTFPCIKDGTFVMHLDYPALSIQPLTKTCFIGWHHNDNPKRPSNRFVIQISPPFPGMPSEHRAERYAARPAVFFFVSSWILPVVTSIFGVGFFFWGRRVRRKLRSRATGAKPLPHATPPGVEPPGELKDVSPQVNHHGDTYI